MRPSIVPFHRIAPMLAALLAPGLAHAHITLTDPPARHPAMDLKEGPCGVGAGDSRTTDPNKITTYTAGETITIYFTEGIQHPGHYRVMLSSTGDTGFTDPTGYEDISLSPGDLIDGVMDEPAGQGAEEHEITVTLPSEPCEECTIQLIQVMYDKEPWGPEPNPPNGADIYYQCADIVILPGEGGGSGGASSGGASGSGGGDVASGGGVATGGASGSGGALTGSGGALTGSGGALTGSGGVAAGSGGVIGASGGAPGSGGTGTVPPMTGSSCSLAGRPAGNSSVWLGLAGLAWLARQRLSASALRRRARR